jgi:hypothetical protein
VLLDLLRLDQANMQKKKNPRKSWVNWRNYKMSLIKVDKLDKILVYAHEKDIFENTKTLSFLSNSKTVNL